MQRSNVRKIAPSPISLFTRGAFAWAVLVAATPAAAQSAGVLKLSAPEDFREAYLDTPPIAGKSRGLVVGATIVGLRIDGPAARFDPQGIRVALGPSVSGASQICVRVISRDGRYSARARYAVAAGVGAEPVLETRTGYANELSGYKSTDMAIAVRSANSCDDVKSATIYAVDMGAGPAKQLVVQLNAGEARTRAVIAKDKTQVTDAVLCQPLEFGVGFSHECRLELPESVASGQYQLNIGETSSTGEISVRSYGLALYKAGLASK